MASVRRTRRFAVGTVSVFSFVALWELLLRADAINSIGFSSPLRALVHLLEDPGPLLFGLLTTMTTAFLGLFLALAIGPVIAVTMARSELVHSAVRPLVDFGRPLPSSVMIYVAAAGLGIGLRSKLFVVAYGCVWPVLINTLEGMNSLSREATDSLETLDLPILARIKFVYSRAVLPSLLSGVQVSAGVALILSITFEMLLGATEGLGRVITIASNSANYDLLYAAVLVAGLGGMCMNLLVEKACTALKILLRPDIAR